MTIEQRHLDLINAAIDGELGEQDTAELERLLADSAEARALKADLERTDAVLRSVPKLEPPHALQDTLVAGLPQGAARQGSSLRYWLHEMRPGAGLRYALAASAGALVAAVVFNGSDKINGAADPNALVGTMVSGSTRNDGEMIADYAFRSDASASQLQLQRYEDALLLEIRIESQSPLDVSIGLADTGLAPGAVAQHDGIDGAVAISHDNIRLRATGEQQISILLRREGNAVPAGQADIALEFSSNGQVLEQGSLPATW
jgi:hypothetical protein